VGRAIVSFKNFPGDSDVYSGLEITALNHSEEPRVPLPVDVVSVYDSQFSFL
jgi:hypothetical protein